MKKNPKAVTPEERAEMHKRKLIFFAKMLKIDLKTLLMLVKTEAQNNGIK